MTKNCEREHTRMGSKKRISAILLFAAPDIRLGMRTHNLTTEPTSPIPTHSTLKLKAGKALDDVQEQLEEVKKERRHLLKQQRALQKFLGLAPVKDVGGYAASVAVADE